MNISTRITEYSITGGVLWVNVFLFATLFSLSLHQQAITIANGMHVWSAWIGALTPLKTGLDALPESLQGSIGTLLGALAVIVIFLSGILLDLISPVFCVPFELYYFRKWLVAENRGWLDPLIAANGEFIAAEYGVFVGERLMDWKHPLAWFKQRRYYNKLASFLLSHVMIFSQGAALDDLMDRVHLWRTSRAISTSMVVLGVLMNFTPLAPLANNGDSAAGAALITMGIPLLLFAVSATITIGTYSRMCLLLCALAFATARQSAAAR